MTYFELFQIPLSLTVDIAALSKTYIKLSRQYHPDFHTQASETEQEHALEMTSLLNKAWKTFQNKEATLRYALTVKGILDPEEKQSLSPEFLMDMMDINEAITEGDPANKPALLAKIQAIEDSIYTPVIHIIEQYNDALSSSEELLKVKAYYFQKKYLNRIRSRISA